MTSKILQEAHSHKCHDCGIVWDHPAMRVTQMTDEDFDRIHQCPRCGKTVTEYYYGLVGPKVSSHKPFVFEDHSSLLDAEQVEMCAYRFPVYTEADFKCIEEDLLNTHATLRRVFMGGLDAPEDWRIPGTVYKEWDDRLIKAHERLVLRYRASRFFAGQRRADQRKAQEQKNLGSWIRLNNAEEYQVLKLKGFAVREIRAGRTTHYEYATVKEPPPSKTDALNRARVRISNTGVIGPRDPERR